MMELKVHEDGTGSSLAVQPPSETTDPNIDLKEALRGLPLEGIEDAKEIASLFKLRDENDNEVSFMPKGYIGMIAGYGGTGKSLLALELALLVADPRESRPRGRNNECLVSCGTSQKVVLIFGEENMETCAFRLKQAFESLDMLDSYRKLKDRLLVIPLGGVSFSTALVDKEQQDNADDWLDCIKERLEDFGGDAGLDLIVIDPLSHFGGSEFETDNGQAVRLMRKLNELTALKGRPTVLGIHHSAKGAKNGRVDEMLRGSSALKDNSRWVGSLNRVGESKDARECLLWHSDKYKKIAHEVVELEVAKSNYSKKGQTVRFAIGPQGMIRITDEEYLAVNVDNGMTPDDLEERLSDLKKAIEKRSKAPTGAIRTRKHR